MLAIWNNGQPLPATVAEVNGKYRLIANGRCMQISDEPILANVELDRYEYILTGPLPTEEEHPGPKTHVLTDVITTTRTVIPKTAEELAEELAEEQQADDIATIKTSVDTIAFILVECIDQLLADTTIQATDFTPAVRQLYLDFKPTVTRAKPT
jgi:hypothetical protein